MKLEGLCRYQVSDTLTRGKPCTHCHPPWWLWLGIKGFSMILSEHMQEVREQYKTGNHPHRDTKASGDPTMPRVVLLRDAICPVSDDVFTLFSSDASFVSYFTLSKK